MIKNGHVSEEPLEESSARAIFIGWIRERWNPCINYPKRVRGKSDRASTQGRYVQHFENKLYDYYDSLLGPMRRFDVKPSELDLPGQLGLFARTTFNSARIEDRGFLWGDFHRIDCTPEKFKKYKGHSSIFFLPSEVARLGKHYVLDGPLSLCNHHCEKGEMCFDIKGPTAGKRKYKPGKEIFIYYSEDYFQNGCVCCKKM